MLEDEKKDLEKRMSIKIRAQESASNKLEKA
jgi:hypothetical protein